MDVKDSCVFYADWLEAAHTIENPELRCAFFEAILQYALTGMEIETPPELKIVMTIVKKCVDRDREKYEKKIEKRRAAGIKGNQVRWGDSQKSQDVANIANATNESQDVANIADNANDNVNGNVNDNVNDNDKDNDFKYSPIPPKGGGLDFFKDYYLKVDQQIALPAMIQRTHYETQYIWRMAEGIPGYGLDILKAISDAPTTEEAAARIAETNRRYTPSVPFEVFRLAYGMTRLRTSQQKKAFFEELKRSEKEPDIFRTLTEKADYIAQGNKVANLAGFLKSRKK